LELTAAGGVGIGLRDDGVSSFCGMKSERKCVLLCYLKESVLGQSANVLQLALEASTESGENIASFNTQNKHFMISL